LDIGYWFGSDRFTLLGSSLLGLVPELHDVSFLMTCFATRSLALAIAPRQRFDTDDVSFFGLFLEIVTMVFYTVECV